MRTHATALVRHAGAARRNCSQIRHPDGCDAVPAAYLGDDRRPRRRKCDFLFRGRPALAPAPVRQNDRRAGAPSYRPRRRGRFRSLRPLEPGSTSRASRRRGIPARNCARALPSSALRSAFQNTNGTTIPPIRPVQRRGGIRMCRMDQPDGAQQFHARGPPRAGSNQATRASSGSNARRSTSDLAARLISRSPFSSMSRRTPGSRVSRSR